MSSPSYAKNFESLIAIITYLAMHKWALRQAKALAYEISIPADEVKNILDSFPGLFRRSPGKSKDYQEAFYSLHLRHLRQGIKDEEGNLVERSPLGLDDLMPLLDFISRKSEEQSRRGLTITTTLITAGLSLVASTATLIVTVLK